METGPVTDAPGGVDRSRLPVQDPQDILFRAGQYAGAGPNTVVRVYNGMKGNGFKGPFFSGFFDPCPDISRSPGQFPDVKKNDDRTYQDKRSVHGKFFNQRFHVADERKRFTKFTIKKPFTSEIKKAVLPADLIQKRFKVQVYGD